MQDRQRQLGALQTLQLHRRTNCVAQVKEMTYQASVIGIGNTGLTLECKHDGKDALKHMIVQRISTAQGIQEQALAKSNIQTLYQAIYDYWSTQAPVESQQNAANHVYLSVLCELTALLQA